MDLETLLNEREQAQQRMQALADLALRENRDLTDEENTEYSGLEAKVNSHTTHINRLTKLSQLKIQNEADRNAAQAPTDEPYQAAPADHINRGASKNEKKDLNKYSFRKAFLATRQQGRLNGLELEMHQEGENEYRSSGCEPGDGVIIPKKVLWHGSRRNSAYRNDMTTGSGEGDDLIATEVRAPIDVLYDALVLNQLGVTTFFGLEGNLSFPVMGAAAVPAEKAENAAADEVTGTTSNVTMAPERLPVVTEMSTQLLRQSTIDVELWLRNHLLRNMAARMQAMAINGSGSSNEPTGVLQTGGLTLEALGTNGAAPTRTTLTRLGGHVSVANAAMGRLGFLTNGKVQTTLMETKTDAGSGRFVWPEETADRLLGHPAAVTNAVPSTLVKGASGSVCSAIIFGNWEDLVIGQWGGITLLSDPYTKMTTGLIRIGAEAFYDVLVQRAASFAATKDALTVIN